MAVEQKLAIIIEDELTLGSPAQKILDRFLIGFQRDGVFQEPPKNRRVEVFLAHPDTKLLSQRRDKFQVVASNSPAESAKRADAAVFIQQNARANDEALKQTIQGMRPGAPLFVHGLLSSSRHGAETLTREASERNIALCAGTVMSTLQELPPMNVPSEVAVGAQIREALIIMEGSSPEAELSAFDAIASVLDRNGGVHSIRNVRTLEGKAVWDAAGKDWSWRLLASALSRTDKAQGNTLLDGRTEDIVGLGLTQKMARNPRARIIEHSRGIKTAILILDGVVGDIVVAVKAGRRFMPGSIYSTQLFQSHPPQNEQYSRLVAAIEEFFAGRAPWQIKRSVVAAEFAERIGK